MPKLTKPMTTERSFELVQTFDKLFETEGLIPVLRCVSNALAYAVDRHRFEIEIPEGRGERTEHFRTHDMYVVADHLMWNVMQQLRERSTD